MIDLNNTWCDASVSHHDKLRYMGFDHEPPSSNIEFYCINEHYEVFSVDKLPLGHSFKQIHLVNGEFEYVVEQIPKNNFEE